MVRFLFDKSIWLSVGFLYDLTRAYHKDLLLKCNQNTEILDEIVTIITGDQI